ncbi:hypothetical protein NVP1084O_196 [Vibrio phage 1.084.O._10N.261.49.F5]|nr:hypothetical protein NVP1084O_196 [Vibrio phage 1.084.O._10N.261.49.F5]
MQLENLIGKQFKCNTDCLDFEDLVGTITNAWDESEDGWTITYMKVEGDDWSAVFDFSEGDLL